jgi:hypothetical protein
LISATGQLILQQNATHNKVLQIPQCGNGVYQLEVIQKDLIYQSKIIINNSY